MEKPKSNLKSFEVKGKTYEMKAVKGFWYAKMKKECTDIKKGVFDINQYQNNLLENCLNDYYNLDDFNASNLTKSVTLESGTVVQLKLMSVQDYNELLMNSVDDVVDEALAKKVVQNIKPEELELMDSADIMELVDEITDFIDESPLGEVGEVLEQIESFLGVNKGKLAERVRKAMERQNK